MEFSAILGTESFSWFIIARRVFSFSRSLKSHLNVYQLMVIRKGLKGVFLFEMSPLCRRQRVSCNLQAQRACSRAQFMES
jgi:hypothetical protein